MSEWLLHQVRFSADSHAFLVSSLPTSVGVRGPPTALRSTSCAIDIYLATTFPDRLFA